MFQSLHYNFKKLPHNTLIASEYFHHEEIAELAVEHISTFLTSLLSQFSTFLPLNFTTTTNTIIDFFKQLFEQILPQCLTTRGEIDIGAQSAIFSVFYGKIPSILSHLLTESLQTIQKSTNIKDIMKPLNEIENTSYHQPQSHLDLWSINTLNTFSYENSSHYSIPNCINIFVTILRIFHNALSIFIPFSPITSHTTCPSHNFFHFFHQSNFNQHNNPYNLYRELLHNTFLDLLTNNHTSLLSTFFLALPDSLHAQILSESMNNYIQPIKSPIEPSIPLTTPPPNSLSTFSSIPALSSFSLTDLQTILFSSLSITELPQMPFAEALSIAFAQRIQSKMTLNRVQILSFTSPISSISSQLSNPASTYSVSPLSAQSIPISSPFPLLRSLYPILQYSLHREINLFVHFNSLTHNWYNNSLTRTITFSEQFLLPLIFSTYHYAHPKTIKCLHHAPSTSSTSMESISTGNSCTDVNYDHVPYNLLQTNTVFSSNIYPISSHHTLKHIHCNVHKLMEIYTNLSTFYTTLIHTLISTHNFTLASSLQNFPLSAQVFTDLAILHRYFKTPFTQCTTPNLVLLAHPTFSHSFSPFQPSSPAPLSSTNIQTYSTSSSTKNTFDQTISTRTTQPNIPPPKSTLQTNTNINANTNTPTSLSCIPTQSSAFPLSHQIYLANLIQLYGSIISKKIPSTLFLQDLLVFSPSHHQAHPLISHSSIVSSHTGLSSPNNYHQIPSHPMYHCHIPSQTLPSTSHHITNIVAENHYYASLISAFTNFFQKVSSPLYPTSQLLHHFLDTIRLSLLIDPHGEIIAKVSAIVQKHARITTESFLTHLSRMLRGQLYPNFSLVLLPFMSPYITKHLVDIVKIPLKPLNLVETTLLSTLAPTSRLKGVQNGSNIPSGSSNTPENTRKYACANVFDTLLASIHANPHMIASTMMLKTHTKSSHNLNLPHTSFLEQNVSTQNPSFPLYKSNSRTKSLLPQPTSTNNLLVNDIILYRFLITHSTQFINSLNTFHHTFFNPNALYLSSFYYSPPTMLSSTSSRISQNIPPSTNKLSKNVTSSTIFPKHQNNHSIQANPRTSGVIYTSYGPYAPIPKNNTTSTHKTSSLHPLSKFSDPFNHIPERIGPSPFLFTGQTLANELQTSLNVTCPRSTITVFNPNQNTIQNTAMTTTSLTTQAAISTSSHPAAVSTDSSSQSLLNSTHAVTQTQTLQQQLISNHSTTTYAQAQLLHIHDSDSIDPSMLTPLPSLFSQDESEQTQRTGGINGANPFGTQISSNVVFDALLHHDNTSDVDVEGSLEPIDSSQWNPIYTHSLFSKLFHSMEHDANAHVTIESDHNTFNYGMLNNPITTTPALSTSNNTNNNISTTQSLTIQFDFFTLLLNSLSPSKQYNWNIILIQFATSLAHYTLSMPSLSTEFHSILCTSLSTRFSRQSLQTFLVLQNDLFHSSNFTIAHIPRISLPLYCSYFQPNLNKNDQFSDNTDHQKKNINPGQFSVIICSGAMWPRGWQHMGLYSSSQYLLQNTTPLHPPKDLSHFDQFCNHIYSKWDISTVSTFNMVNNSKLTPQCSTTLPSHVDPFVFDESLLSKNAYDVDTLNIIPANYNTILSTTPKFYHYLTQLCNPTLLYRYISPDHPGNVALKHNDKDTTNMNDNDDEDDTFYKKRSPTVHLPLNLRYLLDEVICIANQVYSDRFLTFFEHLGIVHIEVELVCTKFAQMLESTSPNLTSFIDHNKPQKQYYTKQFLCSPTAYSVLMCFAESHDCNDCNDSNNQHKRATTSDVVQSIVTHLDKLSEAYNTSTIQTFNPHKMSQNGLKDLDSTLDQTPFLTLSSTSNFDPIDDLYPYLCSFPKLSIKDVAELTHITHQRAQVILNYWVAQGCLIALSHDFFTSADAQDK